MGHLVGKEIYQKLGHKIDSLMFRAPQNEKLYAVLKELYSTEEADVVIKMPYSFSNLNRISKSTGYDKPKLQKIIDGLTSKGLVLDIWANDAYYYMPSPIVVGIFEFTMMRTGNDIDTPKMAKLLHDYMQGDSSFYEANFGDEQKLSVMRAVPHDEAIRPSEYMEVLDYEKAVSLVEETNKFSVGICSCRHKKLHLGEKECKVPLESCTSFGIAADYVIRHNFGREVSKTEMLENLALSKEHRLVLNADNVQHNIRMICQCCKCCCATLQGISKFGYPHSIVTSSLIAEIDEAKCIGCGKCAKTCPIEAIEMITIENPKTKKKKNPVVNKDICLGCGVCALDCKTKALQLTKRKQKVIHPATTFERIILQSLERGTIQNQLFDFPESISHKTMRGILGAFFKLPPVKKALMSDILRSSFLGAMKMGAHMQGRGWLTKL
ncbi:MAG: 4Fe-4S ferredoxin [Smithella sp. SDB]|nr:MAG: 4Fe-4S ferredoxin [Smithella sp. SDB]